MAISLLFLRDPAHKVKTKVGDELAADEQARFIWELKLEDFTNVEI